MSGNATIKLKTPIQGHESPVSEIVLREPKYSDVMALGEPAAFARSEGGMIYQAEKDGIIQSYIERLIVEPKDTGLLAQLSLTDTLQLKEAVFGFFHTARAAISN
jgi:hypothetical protein